MPSFITLIIWKLFVSMYGVALGIAVSVGRTLKGAYSLVYNSSAMFSSEFHLTM